MRVSQSASGHKAALGTHQKLAPTLPDSATGHTLRPMPMAARIFFAFLVGLAVVIHNWQWIATLSPGAAAFLGTLVGAALGLSAILLGALYNAELNRRRDDRLRADERAALLEALAAELEMYRNLLQAHAGRARNFQDNITETTDFAALREHLRLPAPAIYNANLARLGLIGGRLTASIAHAYVTVADITALVATIPAARLPNALSVIAKRFLGTRGLVTLAHHLLLAEIEASGGVSKLRASDETVDAIFAAAGAETDETEGTGSG